jgi:segregation and condensation protein A
MALPGSFDGPLDLLLEEVRRQRVAIEEINLAPIVARFLEYMRTAAERNLNLDIEWLDMAATLIHWKSRSLLPGDPLRGRQADPIRDDLVQRLLAHRKEAGEELGRLRAAEEARFTRAAESVTEGPAEPPFVTVWDMIQQARDIASWAGERREGLRRWQETIDVERDDVTVAQMMEYLGTRLNVAAGQKLDGLGLLSEQPTVSHRSCLFLGMLEMARDRKLELEQNESFGALVISDIALSR